MRKMLRNSGLTAVILISLAATVLLPKKVSQWVVLVSILLFAISKSVRFFIEHKEDFLRMKKRAFSKKEELHKPLPTTLIDIKYVINHLSHRITDKLHSAFPESSWDWVDKPSVKLFTEGGIIRIRTHKTEEFNEADVILDSFGRIDFKMLKASSIAEIIKAEDENAEVAFTVDTKVWFEQCGQKALTELITELNAKGTKTLLINEDGSVVLEDNKQVGSLKSFPSKNLWKKLIGIFEEQGLTAVENEDSILLGW